MLQNVKYDNIKTKNDPRTQLSLLGNGGKLCYSNKINKKIIILLDFNT